MYIHFAFGSLGKQGKIEEQTNQVIEYVLKWKRLKVSKCKEFIPAFPIKGAKRIPREMFKVTDDGIAATFHPREDPAWFDKLPDDKTIHYLPFDVPMICFIKTSFSKLQTSLHPKEYGKFGIVLNYSFLKENGMKPVYYYTEESLWRDSLIRRWNAGQGILSGAEKTNLEKEIVSYRKPASLFPSFKKSVITKITRNIKGVNIEYLTYDRYPEGYDFTTEAEHRIVFNEGIEYFYFDESDLYMIITPDSDAKIRIDDYLNNNWSKRPHVVEYPS